MQLCDTPLLHKPIYESYVKRESTEEKLWIQQVFGCSAPICSAGLVSALLHTQPQEAWTSFSCWRW